MRNKLTFGSFLLILIATAIIDSNTALANPPLHEKGFKPPDSFTKPSEITVFSPINGTLYKNNTLLLSINVTLPQSSTASGTILYYVTYTSDWDENETVLYHNKGYVNTIESQFPDSQRQYFSGSFEITNIPYGEHNLIITAYAGGFYPEGADGFYRFRVNGTSTVFFTVGNPATPTLSSPPIIDNPIDLRIDYFLPISVILIIGIVLSVLTLRRHRRNPLLRNLDKP